MSSWPGPFTAANSIGATIPLPYGSVSTHGSNFGTSNNIPAGLVSASVFGFYKLIGIPVLNQIQVDPEPTPVGK